MRTYDDWKTTEPDNEPRDECNRCGKLVAKRDLWLVCGPDDWVCTACCEDEA
jgi:hypothetical protein